MSDLSVVEKQLIVGMFATTVEALSRSEVMAGDPEWYEYWAVSRRYRGAINRFKCDRL